MATTSLRWPWGIAADYPAGTRRRTARGRYVPIQVVHARQSRAPRGRPLMAVKALRILYQHRWFRRYGAVCWIGFGVAAPLIGVLLAGAAIADCVYGALLIAARLAVLGAAVGIPVLR